MMKTAVTVVQTITLFLFTFSTYASDREAFDAYIDGLRSEAIEQGYDSAFIDNAFATIKMHEKVITRDRNQPERKITLDEYLATRVPDWKVEQASDLLKEHEAVLNAVEKQFGVQKRFIVALWGNESNFGRIQGKVPVLSALATLAFEGRREALFRKQFFAALSILNDGHISLDKFTGSWAGAMGQSQFLPTSFLTYAVDFDQDGKTDIWQSKADVFASIANYLSQEGWRHDQTWGRQVKLSNESQYALAGLNRQASKSLLEWQALGITRFNGMPLPHVDIPANLIMPDGPSGRAYLVYNNFQTLMKWNRSSYFGISVSHLSERMRTSQ